VALKRDRPLCHNMDRGSKLLWVLSIRLDLLLVVPSIRLLTGKQKSSGKPKLVWTFARAVVLTIF